LGTPNIFQQLGLWLFVPACFAVAVVTNGPTAAPMVNS
jgi:hypothetical protein